MPADLTQQAVHSPQVGNELDAASLGELAVPLKSRRPLAAGREILGRANERIVERLEVLDKLAVGSEKQIDIDRRELGRVLADPRAVHAVKAIEQRITNETELLQQHRASASQLGEAMRRSAEMLVSCEQLELRAEKLEINGLSTEATSARASAVETLRRAYALLSAERNLVADPRFNELLERLRSTMRRATEGRPALRAADRSQAQKPQSAPESSLQARTLAERRPGEATVERSPAAERAPELPAKKPETNAGPAGSVVSEREAPLALLRTPVENDAIAAVRHANLAQTTVQREMATFARESEVWASVNGALRAAKVITVLPPVETDWVKPADGVDHDPTEERQAVAHRVVRYGAFRGAVGEAVRSCRRRFSLSSKRQVWWLRALIIAGAAAAILLAEVV